MADEAEGSPSDLGRRVPLPSQARRAARALEAEAEEAEEDEQAEEDEADEEEEDEDEENEEDDAVPWPEWYTSLPGNELYAEIDEEFLLDEFNLTGLASVVPHYHHALDLILDAESEEGVADADEEAVQASAELLYGLAHARFIVTSKGLAAMAAKHARGEFGVCPRVHCEAQRCLPVGPADVPRLHTVKLFCPRCRDVYHPRQVRHAAIDGAFFGTTFPHILCQTYPDLLPPPPATSYAPRIFGFKVHRPAGAPRPVHERPFT